ncbi:MAG: hypothetical protein ABI624_08905 [Casimicrobiaceae bacterium]
MPPKQITYRGVAVIEGWPEKIRAAQSITTCYPNGVKMERVRYGFEGSDWGANDHPCHDCAVIKGEFHVPDCDAERCPNCGGQFGGCDCDWPEENEA